MASQNSMSLHMSSQESNVSNMLSDGAYNVCIEEVSDVLDIFSTVEPFEEKFHIAEDLPMPPLQQPMQILSEPTSQLQMLTNEEFPGLLNFLILPDHQDDTKSWVYSQKLKKVYIEMEKTLPVRVKWSSLHSGLYIRAVMAFCMPTHRSEPVTRCHNHIALSKPEVPYLRHVLSCKNTNATYHEMNGHYSVVVPLGIPQPGADYVQMDFMFHCKNSCSTGINRRTTEVVFNLETESGELLGRRKLLVRICSCPKRDREKDERVLREYAAPKKRKLAPGKKFMPVYREQPQLDPESEVFTFTTRIHGRENYETLKRLTHGLMAGSIERGGPRAIIKPLMDEILHMP